MIKIFVVGCPRSGTTLVQKLLGARDDVYTCKETHYFQKIRRKGKWKALDYLMLSKNNVVDAFEFICANNELLGEYDPCQVGSLRSAALFLDEVMTSEAQSRRKVAWVEKTPPHVFDIGWIRRHIPTAKFVHVLRDGRDVVASMVDAARRFPQATAWRRYASLEMAIEEYNRCLRESLKYHRSQGHVFVRYEHILDDVERVCHQLYRSLGLDGEMVDLNFDGIDGQIVRSDEGWKSNWRGEIRDTRLVKFNRIFSDEQRSLIVSSLNAPPSRAARGVRTDWI
ncbi:MAG: sulfotransferase family protein [bacterium]